MKAHRLIFPSSTSLPSYARTIDRAVHLRIFPRPANINESRQILSVLQNYGEVVYYQHMKYDPVLKAGNTALALYKDGEEAKKLLEASPLRLEMGNGGVREVVRKKGEGVNDSRDVEEEGSCSVRETELRVEPSRLNHQAYIQRQHYYGYFEPETTSAMYLDLERRVPVVGMADCRIDKEEPELRLRQRRMAREQKEKRGRWRQSLGDLWRKGEEKGDKGNGTATIVGAIKGYPGLDPVGTRRRKFATEKGV